MTGRGTHRDAAQPCAESRASTPWCALKERVERVVFWVLLMDRQVPSPSPSARPTASVAVVW